MLGDLKNFILRGNVVDLAVGVVIGGAFGAISKSLVDDVLMPPLGLLLGKVDMSNLFVTLKDGVAPGPYPTLAAAKTAGAVTIRYGLFLNTIVVFLLTGIAMYLVMKVVSAAYRKKEAAAAGPDKQDKMIELLAEIRDGLKR